MNVVDSVVIFLPKKLTGCPGVEKCEELVDSVTHGAAIPEGFCGEPGCTCWVIRVWQARWGNPEIDFAVLAPLASPSDGNMCFPEGKLRFRDTRGTISDRCRGETGFILVIVWVSGARSGHYGADSAVLAPPGRPRRGKT